MWSVVDFIQDRLTFEQQAFVRQPTGSLYVRNLTILLSSENMQHINDQLLHVRIEFTSNNVVARAGIVDVSDLPAIRDETNLVIRKVQHL